MFQSFGIPRGSGAELAIMYVMGAIIYANVFIFLRRFACRFGHPDMHRTWLRIGGGFVGMWAFYFLGWKVVFYFVEPGWGRSIGLLLMPFTIISGAVAGYLLTRHWTRLDNGEAYTNTYTIPESVVIRRTTFVMLAIFGFIFAIQIYFNWTAMLPSSTDAARRAPAVAALLAEVNAKREWRDIRFDCALLEKHLGKSDRVGHYAKQFEAYGVSANPYFQNHKWWMYYVFNRPILRRVPFPRFWPGDVFTVSFQIKDNSPDAIIEKCGAVLWAHFPYI